MPTAMFRPTRGLIGLMGAVASAATGQHRNRKNPSVSPQRPDLNSQVDRFLWQGFIRHDVHPLDVTISAAPGGDIGVSGFWRAAISNTSAGAPNRSSIR